MKYPRRLLLDKHLFQKWATEEESVASALAVKKAETAGKTVVESQPSTAASYDHPITFISCG